MRDNDFDLIHVVDHHPRPPMVQRVFSTAANSGARSWLLSRRIDAPLCGLDALRYCGAAAAKIGLVSESGGRDPAVTISDGRVTLRPWSSDDAPFMAEASADPAIRRYNGVHDRQGRPAPPLSVLEAEAAIDRFALSWRALAATGTAAGVAFAITDAGTGELMGCCGVDGWTTEDVAQFGYWIAPYARGQGYATRAVVLLARWLFELGAARVFLTIVADNQESLAVARRAGFVYEGTMRAHSVWEDERHDVMWFSALPLEWTG
jgi:RimJ/RimL family protein N-acetyltransferase